MRKIEMLIILFSITAFFGAAMDHSWSLAVVGVCGTILCAGRAPSLPYERPLPGSQDD